MKPILYKSASTLALALLTSCAHIGQPSAQSTQSAQTCAAQNIAVPSGMVEYTPTTAVPANVQYAPIQPAWAGGIQKGCYVTPAAGATVKVYRIWTNGTSKFGSWWSLQNPTTQYQAVTDWRTQNAVCPSFNAAVKVATCTLKTGVMVAIGPTQSIAQVASPGFSACAYAANNTIQANLAYPSQNLLVNECADPGSDADTPTGWAGGN